MSNKVKWSELNADVLQSILERLSIINYLKARSVCKNWRVVCKQISSIQDKFPWIIIFPRRRPKSSTCQVFNPQEGKSYTLRNLGNDFSTHHCIATSGSWLLMFDLRSNLYVLNVFTRERIELPTLESHQGRLQVHRLQNNTFNFMINQSSVPARNVLNRTKAVLWVDEKTNGYIVVWSIGLSYIMYTKNGFDFWREIPTKEGPENLHGCQDIVYKDNKLYIFTSLDRIRILDCSQELPRALLDNVDDDPFRDDQIRRGKIGVTVSGEVLMVNNQLNQVFNILKMNSEGTSWDEVESLEGEAWITDLGVTVPAVDGTVPNSIYYRYKSIYRGDLSTQVLGMILDVDKNGHARWFIPSLREL
ncbi:putative F-box protein [Raphanus sativus]|uniref:F-box protein At4g22180 n=1 Tax=Raphanus sativus TaxID=3726 RepID=A0A6J0MT27_RAPSA|nr:putative F-box protein At4g22180 [Raphanus sativus]KAJ4907189.1 putative F-box protein [Raphanus sativus]